MRDSTRRPRHNRRSSCQTEAMRRHSRENPETREEMEDRQDRERMERGMPPRRREGETYEERDRRTGWGQ